MLDYEQIKKALIFNGFKFVKLEFEANVDENGGCDYCDEGIVSCSECDGTGEISIYDSENNITGHEECPNCGGNGEHDCPDCHGRGDGEIDLPDFQEKFVSKFPTGFTTSYIEAYHDGSVNTEVTMTFSVKRLHQVEDIVKAFKKTCEEYGDWNTRNAGFHISILPSRYYPIEKQLDDKKINNFVRSVNKIIEAMFYLSTEYGSETRSLEYRQPQVSMSNKYSAIYTHNNTCIEYRIFDTCYDQPEKILSYFNTIVRTLKFYSTKHYLTENWTNHDMSLEFRDSYGKVSLKKLARNTGWRNILFKKLIYLYSDQKKLAQFDMYNKSGRLSEDRMFERIIGGDHAEVRQMPLPK